MQPGVSPGWLEMTVIAGAVLLMLLVSIAGLYMYRRQQSRQRSESLVGRRPGNERSSGVRHDA